MSKKHQLAYIDPEASIGNNVTIEPFAYIEKGAIIGDDCWIGPHAVIMNGSILGKGVKVFPGAIVGAVPQDLKYAGESSTVEVGDNTIIREYCTLNRGTEANHKTSIGKNCLLMAYVHIAHDCIIDDFVVLANNVTLAGHIEIGKFARIGGMTAVHQFVKIGPHCFIGGGSLVRKDVPPYVKAAREPLSYVGINSVGLRRRGFTDEQIHQIQDIYRLLFVKSGKISGAVHAIEATINPTPIREEILAFVKGADRGVMRGFRQLSGK